MEHGEETLVYLVIQKAVYQVGMNALEDADDGEGHHQPDRVQHSFHQKEAKAPRRAQNENLSNGFERQHPAKTKKQNNVSSMAHGNAFYHIFTLASRLGTKNVRPLNMVTSGRSVKGITDM